MVARFMMPPAAMVYEVRVRSWLDLVVNDLAAHNGHH
jgi:hypothetical protein